MKKRENDCGISAQMKKVLRKPNFSSLIGKRSKAAATT